MKCSGLYDGFLEKKNRGESLNWDGITRDELYQLWGEEGIPDSMIATLFDIDQRDVTKKRHHYNIKQSSVSARQVWEKIESRMWEVPEYLERYQPAEKTDRVQMIFNEIQQLTPKEKNSLVILLADDPVFEDVYIDADHWNRLYNAVKR